jgi:hypothetical protein
MASFKDAEHVTCDQKDQLFDDSRHPDAKAALDGRIYTSLC